MATATSSGRTQWSKWLRRLGWVVLGLIVFLVVAYFVVTSNTFFKGFILPKVSEAVNAKVTVTEASISPFSQVVLYDLKVEPAGQEPVLTAKKMLARYGFLDLISGKIKVDEVELDTPTLRIVQKADGTSNLDPILQAMQPGSSGQPPASSSPSSSPTVAVQKLALNKGTISFTRYETNGNRMTADIADLNVTLGNLANGQTAKLTVGSNLRFSSAGGTNASRVAATLNADFNLGLTAALAPEMVKGTADLNIAKATGAFADADQMEAKLSVDLSPTNVKQMMLRFSRTNSSLGLISVSGPFDLAKQEGHFKVEVTGIGHEVLSLVGGPYGIYFGNTELAATYDIELKNQAKLINTSGLLTANQFSLTQTNLNAAEVKTPVIDLKLTYNATVDRPKTNILMREFSLNATQNGQPLLQAGLTKPLTLDWGKGSAAVEDSTFELILTNLNLENWQPLIGTNISQGTAGAKLTVNVQHGGGLITFNLNSELNDLAAQYESNRLKSASMTLVGNGQIKNFAEADLNEFKLNVTHSGQPMASFATSGQYNLQTQNATIQMAFNTVLPQLTAWLNLPDVQFSSGSVKFNGSLTQTNLTPKQPGQPVLDRAILGTLQLGDVTGQFASNRLDRFVADANLDLAVKGQQAAIRKFNGSIQKGGQPAGHFEVTGQYDLAQQTGDLTFKLQDLNQHLLNSFVATALGDRKLASISISANANAKYAARGDSSIQGDLQVANFQIAGPGNAAPPAPMTLAATLGAGLSAQGIADIRQCDGTIRQGDKSGGSFSLTGQCNLTNLTGQAMLKLTDLNQHALRPFLAPALGDKTLDSISINANASARYEASGEASVKSDLQVTNLVVTDPTGGLPKTPLAAGVQLDASLAKQILDLRQAQLTLTPTARAKNQLQLAGKVDMTQTNAITGDLQLTAEALDLTPVLQLVHEPIGFSIHHQPGRGKSVNQTTPAFSIRNRSAPDPLAHPAVDGGSKHWPTLPGRNCHYQSD